MKNEGDPDMHQLIKIILAVVMTISIVIHCGKQPTNPERKAIQFKFKFQFQDGTYAQDAAIPPGLRVISPPLTAIQKASDLQAFDMVRIMAIDLSAYVSFVYFRDSTETGRAYWANRAVWNGDRGNWAEWKKFWQDYATIVVDQALDIQGTEAVGTVTGVLGLNEFVAAFFKNGRVQWWVSGEGDGKKGETNDVTWSTPWEVPPLDPCLTKPMDKSPEEAVFNAAFGK
jgi:hypothetical protein